MELLNVFETGSAIDVKSYDVTFVTPIAVHGVDSKNTAEFRASSLKGIYRYWWRTLQTDSKNLLAREEAYFGGTSVNKRKSPVTIVVKKAPSYNVVRTNVRPHNTEKRVMIPTLQKGQQATIELRAKKGQLDDSYIHYWEYVLHVGNFGQRARRGFGACQTHTWDSVADYVASLKNVFERLQVADAFEWSSSALIVKRRRPERVDHPIVENIYIGAPKKTADEVTYAIGVATHEANGDGTLGSAKQRWGSPLHCTVRKIGEQYYPIVTEVTPPKAKQGKRYEEKRRDFLAQLGVQL
ncbi:type III-B CRISPR module RAMP protein Cmr1 [Caryophanon latum]|uniref:Type III-B CRISPR module RAMP protein Cmr1 n=1 Tax=Caryophanon latum TaxID=33977 RepID=A0A1C0YV63_9BACL|nr:type III-B CRISPR module RAMP protein Cmr1 [Caryophanon latum]OCS91024.1 type III-B CRISPR module RAMP protein Cmr1 [Caryophanon latum]